jgi:UDP-glucose:(heptosyl)LPS alpha-1,3-glucosyltransferase
VDGDRFAPGAVPGARAATRRGLGLSDGDYVGLLLASDPWLKGVGTALEALARPEVASLDPAFRLVVAGRRADAAVLRRARRLGVEDRVRLAGPVDDPRPLYAAADVLVHPTFYDPCSLVCLEALAMGLPVVTTPQNGAWEAMGMRGGIAVEDPADAQGVAVAVRVLADPRLRAETADDARYVARKTRLVTRLDQVLDVCRAAARAR